jgi:ABC-type lipoprotein release transport system permease subunit
LAKAGLGEVNTQTFYYSDHSHSGLARVDSSLVYLPFEQAQLLCGMAGPVRRANAVHIKFKPGVKLKAGREKVASLWQKFKQEKAGEKQANLLDTVTVQGWKDYRRAYIAAMEKEQTMMTVMFAFVGITTVFIVFVVFY